MAPRDRTGFTLLECLLVLAIAAILAGVAVPGLLGHERRAARGDAVRALSRLQAEQERYRAQFGLYADQLSALQGVGSSSLQGRYRLSLLRGGPEAYRATAQAQGVQLADTDCPALTLDVSLGYAHTGPSAACWGR
jgi:type IV pilus assembly protein PilE